MNSKLKKKKLILNFLCLVFGFFEIFQFIISELMAIPYSRFTGLAFVLIIGIDFTTAAQCDGVCRNWWLYTGASKHTLCASDTCFECEGVKCTYLEFT